MEWIPFAKRAVSGARWVRQRLRHVLVLVHAAQFVSGSPPGEYYWVTITNLSAAREIEVTHVWFEHRGQSVHIADPALPKRLKLDQSWQTGIPAAGFPSTRDDAYRAARVSLSTGRILKSRRNKKIPPVGQVLR